MYCGAEAELTIRYCKPINKMSERYRHVIFGEKANDRARMARTSVTTYDWRLLWRWAQDTIFTCPREAARPWCRHAARVFEIAAYTTGQPHRTCSSDSKEWFCGVADCWIVSTLVPVTVAIRVQFTRECFRQTSLEGSSQSPHDETFAGLGSE